MYKTLRDALTAWNKEANERQKLQSTYVAIVVVLLVVAGLVSLVNYDLSQKLLLAVFAAAGLFVINLVVWALLQSLVLLPLERSTPNARRVAAARTTATRPTRASSSRRKR